MNEVAKVKVINNARIHGSTVAWETDEAQAHTEGATNRVAFRFPNNRAPRLAALSDWSSSDTTKTSVIAPTPSRRSQQLNGRRDSVRISRMTTGQQFMMCS